MQMRFLHLDEMRVQFGHNDAVMLKVTNLLIGQSMNEGWEFGIGGGYVQKFEVISEKTVAICH